MRPGRERQMKMATILFQDGTNKMVPNISLDEIEKITGSYVEKNLLISKRMLISGDPSRPNLRLNWDATVEFQSTCGLLRSIFGDCVLLDHEETDRELQKELEWWRNPTIQHFKLNTDYLHSIT
jgi:hypothetical protein